MLWRWPSKQRLSFRNGRLASNVADRPIPEVQPSTSMGAFRSFRINGCVKLETVQNAFPDISGIFYGPRFGRTSYVG